MRLLLSPTVCAALGVLMLSTACTRTDTRLVAAANQDPPVVAAARVTRHNLARDMEISAEFRPYQEVDLHAKVAGYLKSIHVDVGDRVTQGQLIGVLEVPEFAEELAHAAASEKRSELDVARAQSEVVRAESAQQIRKISYDRLLSVSQTRPNLVAQQEIDNAAAQLRDAEAQVATARAALAATQQQVQVSMATRNRVRTMMSYLRITAPFSGLVTKRYADAGAMIQAGTASQTQAMPVIRLSQVDRLRLVLPVPESIVTRVRIGGMVEVRVDALKRVFQGKISRFSGRLDTSTRTMDTEVDIPNPGGMVLPGMFGSASLNVDSRSDALAVPVQAVTGHSTKPNVLVISGNRIEQRNVTLGLETPDLLEIVSGVSDGELVVLGNRAGLSPGKHVTPKIVELSSRGDH